MPINPIALRHKLHQNPELSFHEINTTKLLIESIRNLTDSNKLMIITPYKTGLIVDYKVNDDKYLLFRADIDALPIKEENEIAFKSKNNFMHACGHDVHTAILFSFLQHVLKNKIKRNILFLFQPAEESGGAMEFYNTGIFKKYNIKNAFALHVTDEYSIGTVASTNGVLFASSLEINIDFNGVNSHVAFPQEGKNAFNALRLFLDSIDKLPKDISKPFVFGAGKITAGEIRNILPGYARLEGTMRGLSSKELLKFYSKIENILMGIEKITGVNIKSEKGAQYPEVIIDPILYDKLSHTLSRKFNFVDCGYKMTGEDFGFFSHKFPSFMLWLGTSEGEHHGLHNPKFLPDDKMINIGKSVFVEILNELI
ncbi:MAG: amidohydrolase [Bacteroidetes bacterium]|nr:amidohydrolase [Bacteroidota bacterium]